MAVITDKLIIEKNSGIGRITFNNPDKLNALSFEMWRDIPVVLDDFSTDPAIRVVIVSGNGNKAFCAGADISEFKEKRSSEDDIAEYQKAVLRASEALASVEMPTIAKIGGYCIGGGVGIALCCDLRIANDQSRFSVPAAKLGLGYKLEGLQRLVDVVGPAMAKEIFYTARQFNAEEALAMGLANRVLPATALDSFVEDYARRISENAPLTIRAAKIVIAETLKSREARDEELAGRVVDECFESADYLEGQKAFMEKRKPKFLGK